MKNKDSKFLNWFRKTDLDAGQVAMSVATIGLDKTAKAFSLKEERLISYMASAGIPRDIQPDVMSAVGSIAEEVVNGANALYEESIPKSMQESFALASLHADMDDLVGDLVNKSVELSVNGIKPRAVGKESKVKKINEKAAELRLYEVATQMFEHAFTYDNIVVMVNMQGNTINYVQPLDPKDVIVKPTYGFVDGRPGKQVFYKLSNDFVTAFRKGRMDTKNVPAHWIQAMQKGAVIDGAKMKNWVQLDETKGEHVFVLNRKGKADRLVNPTMKRVFPLVAMRRAKLEGEFSVDFHIKSLIHQIIVDKSTGVGTGMWAGAVARATQKELDAIVAKYKEKMGKTIIEATTPEIKHEFGYPEFLKVSPPERYTKVEESIERNFGFSRTITVGDGGGYSSSYVYTKGLIARINHWRSLVGNFLAEVLSRSSKDQVSIAFNNAVLKEAAQVLKESEFALKNGVASPQTVGEDLGYVTEFENMRKEEAQANKELYIPVFETSQGITSEVLWDLGGADTNDDEGGRPPTDGPKSQKDSTPDRAE